MKKKLFTLVVGSLLTLTMSFTAFAGQWAADSTGWWYQNDDGSYAANGWKWIDDGSGIAKCYYFNNSGYCLLGTTTPDGYTVDPSGAWIINGIIQTKKVSSNAVKNSNIPETAVEYNGHHYQIFDNQSSWQKAKSYCESLGGYLAVIEDDDENDFLYKYMLKKDYSSAYFGYTDELDEGDWQWISDEDSAYENWHKGEPNSESSKEDYAMFYWKYTDGTWNDGDFGGNTNGGGVAFICEWN